MHILIAEDEPKNARYLKALIEQYDSNNKVVSICDSVESTVNYLTDNFSEIDLCFMDVHLSDGNSFDIFKKVNVQVPVIYCTAHEDYALDAFRANGVDYLLKPFDENAINRAFMRLQKITRRIAPEAAPVLPAASLPTQSTFVVSSGGRDRSYLVSYKDIALVMLKNEILYLSTKQGNTFYLFDKTIEEMAKLLDPNHFFRINRQMILNKTAIVEMKPSLNRKLELGLCVNTKAPPIVSRPKVSEFMQWVKKAC